MTDLLRFTFESFNHFCGVTFLICVAGFWLGVIATQLGKIGRPRKHVTYSYKDTHKLQ